MAAAVECPNRSVNLQMCSCTNEECERRGVCCLCVAFHLGKDGKANCMRGTERPAATLSLRGVAEARCERHPANLDSCPCDYKACDNRGTCCDCVRNHWGNAAYPSPACMRA